MARRRSAFVFALSVAGLIIAIIAIRIEIASQMESMAEMSPDQLGQRFSLRVRILGVIGLTIVISGAVAFLTSIRIAFLKEKAKH